MAYFSWHGSVALHKAMVKRILNAPVNLYFDSTPTGRIMNRFSQDMTVFDTSMVYLIGSSYVSLYQLLATAIISIAIVPYSAIPLLLSTILFIIFYKMSVPASKETARVS